MGDRVKSGINCSPSKAQFSFPKSDRFYTPKKYTNAFGYSLNSQFNTKRSTNQGRGFNTSQERFRTLRCQSSPKIDGPTHLDRNGHGFDHHSAYSFGVSRDNMKRIYVDDILKQKNGIALPGPASYTAKPGFGPDALPVSRYSMRPKNDPFDIALKRQKKLPGPGSYLHSVDLAGKQPASSAIHAQPSFAFSKNDRWKISGTRTPAPGNYAPKHNFNENISSAFRKPAHTAFSKDRKTFMDQQWKLGVQAKTPAPGSYQRFSDFNGMQDGNKTR